MMSDSCLAHTLGDASYASERQICHMPNENQEATIRQRVQNPAG